jgi:GAF domain-containing protein
MPFKPAARRVDRPTGKGTTALGAAVSKIEDLREEITREERVVNLPPDGTVTPAVIQRRRLQIFLIALVVVVGLVFTTMVNDLWTEVRDQAWLDPQVTRIALAVFAAWVAYYVYDKEQHLKRLSRLSADVDELDRELAAGLLQSAWVLDALESVHSTLELDEVTAHVVEQGCGFFGAPTGRLHLVDDEGVPQLAHHHDVGRGVAGPPPDELVELVVRQRQTVQLDTAAGPAIAVPLVHDGDLLAVLSVGHHPGARFADEAAALLTRFAASAATAIANARRYEAAIFLLDSELTAIPELSG